MPHTNKSSGFTLVELAVALMIIGVMIGGVLKGQELLGNARNAQMVRQYQGFDGALKTFQLLYNVLPGDLNDPTTRLPNCGSLPCAYVGNNNKFIGTCTVPGDLPTLANSITNEPRAFWIQLTNTRLISAVDSTIALGTAFSGKFGVEVPAGAIPGSGWIVGCNSAGARDGVALEAGNVFIIRGVGGLNNASNTTVLNGSGAYYIDSKLDDGLPTTGEVRYAFAENNGFLPAACGTTSPAAYNLTEKARGCNLLIVMKRYQ